MRDEEIERAKFLRAREPDFDYLRLLEKANALDKAVATKARDDTFRKALEMVKEWGDTFCVNREHYIGDKTANTRKRCCRKCWQALEQLGER